MRNDAVPNRRVAPWYVLMALAVLTAYGICFYWINRMSAETSLKAGIQVNEIYLKEMTDQIQNQFRTSLDTRFSILNTIVSSAELAQLSQEEELSRFLREMKLDNRLDFLAFVDENGMYYSEEGPQPGASQIGFLAELLEGKTNLIAYNAGIESKDMILFGTSIAPISCGDILLVGVVAGLNGTDFSSNLSLRREKSSIYASLVTRSGSYVIYNTGVTDLPQGTNLFTKLERYAEFDKGYSLKQMRDDFSRDGEDLLIYTIGGKRLCLYYAPMPETDWYILMEIPSDVVDGIVRNLSEQLNGNSMQVMLLVLVFLFALFLAFAFSMRRNEKRLVAASQAAREAMEQAGPHES